MKPNFFSLFIRLKFLFFKPLQQLVGKGKKDDSQSFIAKTAAGGVGSKIINVALIYILNLLLARFLGTSGYGSYTYVIAWLNLLIIPAVLGLEGLTTREIAIYNSKSQWGLLQGLLRWSNRTVGITSIILASITLFILWFWIPASSLTISVFGVGMIALPFMALARLRQSAMNALKHIIVGYLPESLVRPILMIILLVGSYVVFDKVPSVTWVISIYTVTCGIAFILGNHLLERALPKPCQQVTAEYRPLEWLRGALPMLLIGGMYIVNGQTDTIMLGAMQEPAAVGLYTVANRGSTIVGFVLQAFDTSLASIFASHYAGGRKEELQNIVTKSCRMILMVTLPIAMTLILCRHWFLLIFGADFVQGKTALTILCIGQLINAFTGAVTMLLLMTGHERDTAAGVATSAILNIVLNAVLIPRWGLEGAATATAISMAVWNIILVIAVYKRLGLNSTVFGRIED